MATLAVQNVVDAGTNPTLGAVGATDRADVGNGLNTFLHYKNTSGAPIIITILGSGLTDYGAANPSNIVSVPATTGEAFIPIHRSQDQGDGLGAQITSSAQAGITVALMRR